MKDRPTDDRGTASRSADARGDTGTGADAHRTAAREPGGAGDVGGIPSTVDTGMRDKLGARKDATIQRPIGRAHVDDPAPDRARDSAREPAPDVAAGGTDRPASASASPREAAADEEGPVESLGKAVSETVTGAPRSTPDAPRRR